MTVITTGNVTGPIGAEVTHVPAENVRGSIKDGAIDFVAGSLGKCLRVCARHVIPDVCSFTPESTLVITSKASTKPRST